MLSSSLLERKPGCNSLLEVSEGKSVAPENNKGSLQNKYVTIPSKLTSHKLLEKQPSMSIAMTNTNRLLRSKNSDRLTSHQQLVNSLLVKCQPALGVNPILISVHARAPNLRSSHTGTTSSSIAICHASLHISKQLDSPSNACLISEAAWIESKRTEPLFGVKSTSGGVESESAQLNKQVRVTKDNVHAKAESEGKAKHKKPPISTQNEKQLSVTEKKFNKPNYKLPEDNHDIHIRPLFATMDDFKPQRQATEMIAVKVTVHFIIIV